MTQYNRRAGQSANNMQLCDLILAIARLWSRWWAVFGGSRVRLLPRKEAAADIFKVWPQDWPRYRQPSSTEDCDVVVGPCACGAWHSEGEFRCEQGTLFRYGKPTEEPSQ